MNFFKNSSAGVSSCLQWNRDRYENLCDYLYQHNYKLPNKCKTFGYTDESDNKIKLKCKPLKKSNSFTSCVTRSKTPVTYLECIPGDEESFKSNRARSKSDCEEDVYLCCNYDSPRPLKRSNSYWSGKFSNSPIKHEPRRCVSKPKTVKKVPKKPTKATKKCVPSVSAKDSFIINNKKMSAKVIKQAKPVPCPPSGDKMCHVFYLYCENEHKKGSKERSHSMQISNKKVQFAKHSHTSINQPKAILKKNSSDRKVSTERNSASVRHRAKSSLPSSHSLRKNVGLVTSFCKKCKNEIDVCSKVIFCS
jgi:hypothetical protein